MEAAEITEAAPEGWEEAVNRMRGHDDVEDAPALAKWMKGQGYEPHREVAPLLKRTAFDAKRLGLARVPGLRENSLSTLGALTRAGVHGMTEMYRASGSGGCACGGACRECGGGKMRESAPAARMICDDGSCQWIVPLREAEGGGRRPGKVKVVLITEGPGTSVQRMFYPPETLRESYRIFEGAKAFLDHPSRTEDEDRPERSVRDQCGWFSEAEIATIDGKTAVTAWFNFMRNSAGREARETIESALEYQRSYPLHVLAGFSINGGGPVHPVMMDGVEYRMVDSILHCASVDLVTFPARGGRVLGEMRESEPYGSTWRAAFDSALWRRRIELEVSHAA